MEIQHKLNHKIHSLILYTFLKLFIPVAAIVMIGAIVIFRIECNSELAKIHLAEETAIMMGSSSIERIVQAITRDLSFLVNQKAISEIASGKEEHFNEHIQHDWSAFAKTKGIYDQIRWMNNSGKEEIRVNYNRGNPAIVPYEKLQNKGGRYYFKDAIKLDKGEFFISPLDLNIEKGKIEQPLKPMIRIGTPIFDDNSQKKGVLLLNYLGENMLSEYVRQMGATGSRAWLLNRDGYWLKGASDEMEWGFMYKNHDATIALQYPNSWRKIISSKKGQFVDEHGLWTFNAVYPLIEGQKSSTGSGDAYASSHSALDEQEYFWKSVLLFPIEQYDEAIEQITIRLITVATILLTLLSYGSLRLARAWVAEEKAEEELRKINLNLEHTVEERTKELRNALDEVKTLQGIIPICSYCHNIRDDEGAWNQLVEYLSKHSKAKFSHGICPKCLEKVRKEEGLD